ncbi:hypothetical protein QUF58_05765 [Anaerolineales bacterium HSG24]|nr:hypothetical protein [Anaerolineales bacterium HSG24]
MKGYKIIILVAIYVMLLTAVSTVGATSVAPNIVSIHQDGQKIEQTIQLQQRESVSSTTTFPMFYGKYNGETVEFIDPADLVAAQNKQQRTPIQATGATEILLETFEGSVDPKFQINTDSSYTWGVVPCYSTLGLGWTVLGSKSVWVAGTPNDGNPQLDPCTNTAIYPADLNVTLTYGPFSLADAKNASLDFLYRLESEFNGDFLFWGASKDGINYEGEKISGDYTHGPYQTSTGNPFSYNLESFDLTNVPVLGDLTGETEVWIRFQFSSNSNDITGSGAFLDYITIRKSSATQERITYENFDDTPFPNTAWLAHDQSGSDYKWGSVNCSALSEPNAMWVARGGLGVDPCVGTNITYPKSIESWLIYGPFNLSIASDAWVDFYFRADTELGASPAASDVFWWWASKDGTSYEGQGVASNIYTDERGNQEGYNLMRLDLKKAGFDDNGQPLDMRGERNVWIAFVLLANDNDTTGGGVYVDDVTVVLEQEQTYIPALVRNPTSTPTPVPTTTPSPTPTITPIPNGGFTFRNETGNPVYIELFQPSDTLYGSRSFSADQGPFIWDEIPPGTYDWLLSGTCPQGAGQIGSLKGRAQIIIVSGSNDAAFNDGKNQVDCTG